MPILGAHPDYTRPEVRRRVLEKTFLPSGELSIPGVTHIDGDTILIADNSYRADVVRLLMGQPRGQILLDTYLEINVDPVCRSLAILCGEI